ncbi:MHYT domain-containing protein [Kitasatospora sp. NPDC048365]|uniref:MHYT domain-containing protein n=1 Tax=Kitasatospora sp. NPDC048365 TaxID=3364050 RepID=UPI00370FAA15
MGNLNHFSFGWLTPTLSYLMACVGAALGLRCTLRALAATGTSRRNWLFTAAAAIGSGIWTMHFVAMFGFTVDGTELRYDVPLTILSLVVAVLVVGLGVFAVGYGRHRGRSLLLGGLTTGVGVAAMHYIGMAAVRIHGGIDYDPGTVGLSVLIAVGAATAALWAAITIRTMLAAGGAALVMGIAVSCMHYTGMAAVHVHMVPDRADLGGATPMQFIFPLAVGLGSFLFLTSAFVALSPTAQERAAYREAGEIAVEDLTATSLDRAA